ncbi:hypothetical protein GCM10009676_25800 [Prauserella halophila]|uniref:Uncharacterized protein n=1 Tax=Prauserella halophila TaxID=185641 RepID=A0ABN1WB76_9PSEU
MGHDVLPATHGVAAHNVRVMFQRHLMRGVSRPNWGQVVVTDDPPEPTTGATTADGDEDDE